MGIQKVNITQLLMDSYKLYHLDVINESNQHNVPSGSESHFRLVVVTDDFDGMSAVSRHRAVYDLLNEPISHGIHALAINAWTTEEWIRRHEQAGQSPPCLGGSKG